MVDGHDVCQGSSFSSIPRTSEAPGAVVTIGNDGRMCDQGLGKGIYFSVIRPPSSLWTVTRQNVIFSRIRECGLSLASGRQMISIRDVHI